MTSLRPTMALALAGLTCAACAIPADRTYYEPSRSTRLQYPGRSGLGGRTSASPCGRVLRNINTAQDLQFYANECPQHLLGELRGLDVLATDDIGARIEVAHLRKELEAIKTSARTRLECQSAITATPSGNSQELTECRNQLKDVSIEVQKYLDIGEGNLEKCRRESESIKRTPSSTGVTKTPSS